jgi:ABC-type glycerol-3-phosphate transport system substrate-binding protein
MGITRRDFMGAATGSALLAVGSSPGRAQSSTVGSDVLLPGQPYRGTTLNFISLNYLFSTGIRTVLPAFQEQTGIRVNFELLGTLDNLQKQQLELSTGSSAYDVYQIPPFNRPAYHKAEWLAPLDPFLSNPALTPAAYEFNDFFPISVAQGVSSGKRYDLPIFSATILLYWRRDIFARAGLTKPPETFDEMMETCRILRERVPDVAPIGLRGAAGVEGNLWPFPILLYAQGGKFFRNFPSDMRPALSDPNTVKAVEMWSTLVRQYGFPGSVNATHEEVIVAMQQGRVAMVMDGHPLANLFLSADRSQAHGKTGIAPVPRGPAGRFPAFAEHGIGMAKNARNKPAAWEFIKWATSKGVLLDLAMRTPYVASPRRSTVDNADFQKKNNLADGEYLPAVRRMLEERSPVYTPPIPEWGEVGDAISNAISRATIGRQSAADAMRQADGEVERILRQAGYFR